MYSLLLSSFIVHFFTTFGLFVLCAVTVVGTKYLLIALREYLPKKDVSIPKKNKKPLPTQKKSAKVITTNSKPVRSIEIDPSLIDKIYVKKSS